MSAHEIEQKYESEEKLPFFDAIQTFFPQRVLDLVANDGSPVALYKPGLIAPAEFMKAVSDQDFLTYQTNSVIILV